MGSARTALCTWLSIRRAGGTLVWRLEDLDPPRAVAGAAEAAMEDLAWLGLHWDEGPDRGGPYGPYRQSERSAHYTQALETLYAQGRLFPCQRSRRDLQRLAQAPHGVYEGPGLPPYPRIWRPKTLPEGWFEAFRHPAPRGPGAALRFRVAGGMVRFDDLVAGPQQQRVENTVGDFVLQRRDGLYAYQLAVVVDDLAMDIDEVVRGTDILDSTARQIQLIEALGGRVPRYAHVPLVLNAAGEKLSKRDGALTVEFLRQRGVSPERLVGYLAWTLGLRDTPAPCTPTDLLEAFDWPRLRTEDWVLPMDLETELMR